MKEGKPGRVVRTLMALAMLSSGILPLSEQRADAQSYKDAQNYLSEEDAGESTGNKGKDQGPIISGAVSDTDTSPLIYWSGTIEFRGSNEITDEVDNVFTFGPLRPFRYTGRNSYSETTIVTVESGVATGRTSSYLHVEDDLDACLPYDRGLETPFPGLRTYDRTVVQTDIKPGNVTIENRKHGKYDDYEYRISGEYTSRAFDVYHWRHAETSTTIGDNPVATCKTTETAQEFPPHEIKEKRGFSFTISGKNDPKDYSRRGYSEWGVDYKPDEPGPDYQNVSYFPGYFFEIDYPIARTVGFKETNIDRNTLSWELRHTVPPMGPGNSSDSNPDTNQPGIVPINIVDIDLTEEGAP